MLDDGRVYFVAENLFTASFSLTGSEAIDTWFIIDMEFLVGAGNALTEKLASSEMITILSAQFGWSSLILKNLCFSLPSFPATATPAFMGSDPTGCQCTARPERSASAGNTRE